jgi:hypothetical protein
MRNFIILFEEKEGTSPLVRLLDNFNRISIVHQIDNSGWEPFDTHFCGAMPLSRLERCFEYLFNPAHLDMERLNYFYSQTATKPLEWLDPDNAIGFKMRFRPPKSNFLAMGHFKKWNRAVSKIDALNHRNQERFKQSILDLLSRLNVVVFFAVRQDVLRWGLSKYHGDGTGKPGHLQFKLASGKITKEKIGKIHVDCDRLDKVIRKCEQSHANKQKLMAEFQQAGADVYPLLYEDFVNDKVNYFKRIGNILELDTSESEIEAAIARGGVFKKVHSNCISDFVINHQEVLDRFGDRFVDWKDQNIQQELLARCS